MSDTKPTCKELREFWKAMREPWELLPLFEKLMQFLRDTSRADTPLMTKMIISIGDESRPLLYLWATGNLAESPLYRIEQLKLENQRLQNQLREALDKK